MRHSVLIVEDDEQALKLMTTTLTREGYQVSGAKNSEEAMNYWADFGFDLLLSDVRLLEEDDGFVLADKLLSMRPGVPVLFISGDRDCFASPAIQQFADAPFLRKPFHIKELLSSVASVLTKGRRTVK